MSCPAIDFEMVCNGCDTIDAFCPENEMGYCRECYDEVTIEDRALREAILDAIDGIPG
jgi:hypothetical protein